MIGTTTGALCIIEQNQSLGVAEKRLNIMEIRSECGVTHMDKVRNGCAKENQCVEVVWTCGENGGGSEV